MFVAFVLAAQTAVARPVTLDPRVFAGKASGERASFLVVLREQADISGAAAIRDRLARRRYVYETLRRHAEVTQAALRERLERAGVPYRPHFLVNMIEVEAGQSLARELAASADVSAIERNAEARLELPSAPREASSASRQAAAAGIEPNIQIVRAPELWDRGFRGQGVVIGVADTGLEWEHPALKNQYRGWNGSAASHDYNWHDAVHTVAIPNFCPADSPVPCDDKGHGTGVAGLAVGDDGAGNRIGVAPGARLIACRNMDRAVGTPARYTECFEWLLAPTDANGANPRPELGADIINNSWLCTAAEGCTDPQILKAVVENVRAAGVPVLAAAGNSGFSCGAVWQAPAIYAASFTIGATNGDDDQETGFSSPGPVTVDGSYRLKPDLCAPGVTLHTAGLNGSYQSDFTGTSAAVPQVAGGIALLWSAVPVLAGDVDQTESVLERGAVAMTSPRLDIGYPGEDLDHFCGGYSGLVVPNPVFGWGRLDVEGAYEWYAWINTPHPPREAPILPPKQPPRPLLEPPRP